ncbi:energy-coupling factor ABC transporter permease [Candidatus Chloroploca sp. Khr17]|uniref:energy-coupling factor ABC transporter permease n=1 Tax=Candidatus Chloroploca sp. Khr17 TaxID=2496869 RepID=UPI00101D018B|nr:energy-coupling factor ABC transporter permease [Candidatus Chloroploca sp. Khr17]
MLQSLHGAMVLGLHLPDGLLTVPVALAWWVIAAGTVGYAVYRVREEQPDVAMMGILAACIFAGQMLNVTVLHGTSGHLLGGAMAAMLLGPWAGMLVVAAVVALQALLFQDGGILVLGANIFNMGVVTALLGYGVAKPLLQRTQQHAWGISLAGFVAGWVSVMAAAALTSLQLALSGVVEAALVFPAMLGVHAAIGILEGSITMLTLLLLTAFWPQHVPGLASPMGEEIQIAGGMRPSKVALGGIVLALTLTILAPLASPHPDGLERVAEDQGFLEYALDAPFAILPDYTIPGIDSPLSTILAGTIGVLLIPALLVGLLWLTGTGRRQRGQDVV